jgi:hypothetical protein
MKLFAKTVVAMCAGSFLLAFSLRASDRPSSNEAKTAITFLRIVNTAQQDHAQKNGRFLEWTELNRSKEYDAARLRLAKIFKLDAMQVSQDPATVAGYQIQSAVSTDGKHYVITLDSRSSSDGCGLGFLSDESGLIRETRPIDCK